MQLKKECGMQAQSRHDEIRLFFHQGTGIEAKLTDHGAVWWCRTFYEGPYYRQMSIGFTAGEAAYMSFAEMLRIFQEKCPA